MRPVIIVGSGAPEAIKAYEEITLTPWPVYTDPTRSIQKAFKFSVNGRMSKQGQGREYRQMLGSKWEMMKLALRVWLFRYPGLWNKGGDSFQNGGELILDASESLW
jgi:hypothetical protein